MSKRVLITSALPYANGFLHLGHIASTYIPADVFARYKRLKNKETLFVCATDEHGTPIEVNALKNNLKPEEFVKKIHDEMDKDLKNLGISLDVFYRTHTKEHKEMVDEFFLKAKEKGKIKEKDIEAIYCNNCERFLPDRFIKGTCPFCGAEDQYGDQCEVCGKTYTPKDLKNAKCVLCGSGKDLVEKKTRHYIFDLASFEEELKEWLEKGEFQKDVVNYVKGWIKDGLKEWDITRDKPYFGINILDENDKFYYVWWDAPVGYVSSTKKATKKWKKFWSKDSEIYHFIGKDIMYHHYLFWPAMLNVMDYDMPKHIPTRGYLTINGEKMSKSKGTFITLRDALANFDSDYYRFYFALNTPDKNVDVDFTWNDFQKVINKVLLGEIGNLVNRVLLFSYNNFGDSINLKNKGVLVDKLKECVSNYSKYMDKTEIRKALNEVVKYVRFLNVKFQESEPWRKIKEDKEATKELISEFLYSVLGVSILLKPYIPKHIELLNNNVIDADYSFESELMIKGFKWKGKPRPLIKKIEDKELDLVKGNEIISKIDLRVAKIKEIEEHKDADKLYVLKLDLGNEEKQVVSGIKDYYSKDGLLGKKVVLLYNLKEVKIRGVLSQGMILAGENKEGVKLLEVDGKEGSYLEFEGIPRKPEKEINIKEFMKVNINGKEGTIFYKGRKLYLKKGYEWVPVKVDLKEEFKVR